MVNGLALRNQNPVLYVIPGFEKHQDYLSRLGKHKTGRSCLYVKRLSGLDTPVLRNLLVDSVKDMHTRYECE